MEPHDSSVGGGTSHTKIKRAASPAPSSISGMRYQPIMELKDVSSGGETSNAWTETQRAASPVASCVSMKSDRSIGTPPQFSRGPVPTDPNRTETQRAAPPVSSCVSMKSDESIGVPPHFSRGPVPSDPKQNITEAELQTHTTVERPGASCTKGALDYINMHDMLCWSSWEMAALALLEDIANGRIRRERVFRDHYDFLAHDDDWLISRFRFPRAVLLELCAELGPVLEREAARSRASPVPLQVLTMLGFLATGSFQRELADRSGYPSHL
ncbi:hypothetical protein MHYP_G00091980 [Metynnis hypsauchen]